MMNPLICKRISRKFTIYHSNRSFTFMNGIKNAVSGALNDLRGSLIDNLGRRMNKSDAAILNKYLQQIVNNQNLPDKDENVIINMENTIKTPSSSVDPFPKKKDLISTPAETTTESVEVELSLLHPVFGHMVTDLGYKKVYASNVRRLALSPVWEKQRILRPERSSRIAHSMKTKSDSHIRLPGVITMFHDQRSGKTGIVDGQHRVGALIMLAQQGLWNDLSRNIIVDVFTTNTEDDIVTLFKEINSAEPVRLIDLDFSSSTATASAVESNTAVSAVLTSSSSSSSQSEEDSDGTIATTATSPRSSPSTTSEAATKAATVAVAAIDIRSIITNAVEVIACKYPDMFKPTSRCRSPHLNVDVLRDDLYQAEFVQRHGVRTAEDLVRKLEAVNQALRADYTASSSVSSLLSTKETPSQTKSKPEEPAAAAAAVTKADKFGFYLGLGSKNWINL